jgi:hypothetical protein
MQTIELISTHIKIPPPSPPAGDVRTTLKTCTRGMSRHPTWETDVELPCCPSSVKGPVLRARTSSTSNSSGFSPCVRVRVCVCVRAHVDDRLLTPAAKKHAPMCMCIRMDASTYVDVNVHVHIHKHKCTHIHANIHTHLTTLALAHRQKDTCSTHAYVCMDV